MEIEDFDFPTIYNINSNEKFLSWNTQSQGHFLEIQKDKRTIKYVGQGNHTHDIGAVRTNFILSKDVLIGYYEVTIVDQGTKRAFSMGLADEQFLLTKHPGYEINSYGYKAEDGKKICDAGKEESYGLSYGRGDIVGCGYYYQRHEIFFTYNGRHQGTAFKKVSGDYYPVVAIHSTDAIIAANFGQEAFKFDIHSYIQEEVLRIYSAMLKSPLQINIVDEIVKMYLLHCGFEETFRSFEGYFHRKEETEDIRKSSLTHRKHIRQLVLMGEIVAAQKMIRDMFPYVFTNNPMAKKMIFLCHCQEFIELVRKNELDQCVQFMTETLGVLYKDTDDIDAQLLHDVVALVAYENPEKSPLKYLLHNEQRENLANALNSAILLLTGKSCEFSNLERMLQQLVVCQDLLRMEEGGRGAIFTLDRYISKDKL